MKNITKKAENLFEKTAENHTEWFSITFIKI